MPSDAPRFLLWPDPRLVTSGARAPDARAPEVAEALDRIEAAMAAAGLRALAGPEIGIMRRLGVLSFGGETVRLVNPRIIWKSRDHVMVEESAPGFPGLVAQVSRPEVATLAWTAEDGSAVEKVLTGPRAASACALADQLDGLPLIERLAPAEKRAAQAMMARMGRAQPAAEEISAARRPARAAQAVEDAELVDAARPLPTPTRREKKREAGPMRIVFMGTPEFSVTALDALVAAGHEIVAAYTQPPRPAGRGKQLRASPVQARAEALGIEVRSPRSLKGEAEQAAFAVLGADVAVVVAYGLILPKPVLDAPNHGCINIHASLLPRWRGAAPIQRAIMAGDEETGVCIMRMEEGLDTGPVILREETDIEADDTAETLHDRLAGIGAAAAVEALAMLDRGEAHAMVQPEIGVTYAAKIDKAEAKIDWTKSAAEIDRHIRGLSPFPGAWFEHEGRRIKALLSSPVAGAGAPGETLDDLLTVACGEGAVKLSRIQRAGKGAMPVEEALRGLPIPKGAILD